MRLTTKLWLLIVASIVAGFLLFIAATWLIGSWFTQGYTHVQLNDLGTSLAAEAEGSPSPDQAISLFARFVDRHPQLRVEWFSQAGTLRYASDGRTQSYAFDELMNRFLDMPSSLWESGGRDITLVFDFEYFSETQYLVLSLPGEAMLNNQIYFYVRENKDYFQLLLPLVILFITPYGLALFFFSRMNRRLIKLNRAMNAMDAQRSVISLHDGSIDEIGQLTRHFNAMSRRIHNQVSHIQELENKRRALIANISHDLRTPMTMIQGYAETLHAGIVQDEEERKRYAAIILRRSRYMNELLQKLLEISQLDLHKDQIRIKTVDVSELLRRIAADYVPALEDRETAFDIRIPEAAVYARIDPNLIERAIRNLIDNAIRYGGSGKYVGVALDTGDEALAIRISDRGPGIPEPQQSLIFQRFYRGSHGREGEGLGIGLSIVQEIASAHQGHVRVNSIPHQETVFALILPAGGRSAERR